MYKRKRGYGTFKHKKRHGRYHHHHSLSRFSSNYTPQQGMVIPTPLLILEDDNSAAIRQLSLLTTTAYIPQASMFLPVQHLAIMNPSSTGLFGYSYVQRSLFRMEMTNAGNSDCRLRCYYVQPRKDLDVNHDPATCILTGFNDAIGATVTLSTMPLVLNPYNIPEFTKNWKVLKSYDYHIPAGGTRVIEQKGGKKVINLYDSIDKTWSSPVLTYFSHKFFKTWVFLLSGDNPGDEKANGNLVGETQAQVNIVTRRRFDYCKTAGNVSINTNYTDAQSSIGVELQVYPQANPIKTDNLIG